ncbi:MAG: DbpA RNA binding domain-containing protein, partial [Saprospiraceae bacterium]
EFNRFLAYYKNAQDINVDHKNREQGAGSRERRDDRRDDRGRERRDDRPREERASRDDRGSRERRSEGRRDEPFKSERSARDSYSKPSSGKGREERDRPERSDRSAKADFKPAEFETRDNSRKVDFEKRPEKKYELENRDREPRKRDKYDDKPTPAKRGAERPKVKFTPLVINLGTVNKFNPKELLSLINQYMPDQEAQVGKIEVSYTHTIFDVDADYTDQVIGAFRKAQYRGTKITVDQTRKKKSKEV